jgi:hypothetical protein
MAALLAGQGVSVVARQYKLDAGLVCRWKAKIPATQLQLVATKKQEDFSELLGRYLRSILETNIFINDFVQGKHTSAYLEKQSSAELATFSGVGTDKAIRIFEARDLATESMETPTESPDAIPERIQ